MKPRLLYVTSTEAEASALRIAAEQVPGKNEFSFGNYEISLLVTGVGTVPTVWSICTWISLNGKPDLAVNAGIAGSYNPGIITGSVVVPASDCFADAGVEDNDKFMTLAEAGLADAGEFPFQQGIIHADNYYLKAFAGIRQVRAITSNTATGSASTIRKLVEKYNPDIETMEGASFFYICRRESLPFFALRAISNRIEPRNRDNWNIRLALENLSASLKEILLKLD